MTYRTIKIHARLLRSQEIKREAEIEINLEETIIKRNQISNIISVLSGGSLWRLEKTNARLYQTNWRRKTTVIFHGQKGFLTVILFRKEMKYDKILNWEVQCINDVVSVSGILILRFYFDSD